MLKYVLILKIESPKPLWMTYKEYLKVKEKSGEDVVSEKNDATWREPHSRSSSIFLEKTTVTTVRCPIDFWIEFIHIWVQISRSG